MRILISQVKIVDQRHSFNGSKKDIVVDNGIITDIGNSLNVKVDRTIVEAGMCVSIGWMDFRANFRDPGEEDKESLESGMAAAENGGFTAVAVMPSTQPAIDNKGSVVNLLNKSLGKKVELIAIGAVTQGLQGKLLAEMYDMHQAGAKAFSDDKKSIAHSGLFNRALLYSKNFDTPILHFPHDTDMVSQGQMNEGVQSTYLGLRGMPAISEEIMVQRDLNLLQYTGGILHLGPLSSAKSLQLVAEAKKQGLKISCDITAAHLAYSDEELSSFDTNFKLMPPLRTEENRVALIQALIANDVDVISSDHSPEDEEHKKLEFDNASFGMAGIELFFPLLWTTLEKSMALDALVATFSINPRKILNLHLPEIAIGQRANLTLFNPTKTWRASRASLKTKGYNVAELGKELKGCIVETIYSKA